MADILMITAIAGAENCAAVLSKQFQLHVDTATSRKEALFQLRRREYRLVVIDESMEADDFVRHCGMATPLEINFAISGYGRLERAVRAALSRREREKEVAAQAGASLMESELRETIAGLLLHAELALGEPTVPAAVAARLQVVAELAGILRKRLDAARSTASRRLSVRRLPVEATLQTTVPQKRTQRGGLRSLRNAFKQMVKERLVISLTELSIRRSAILGLFSISRGGMRSSVWLPQAHS